MNQTETVTKTKYLEFKKTLSPSGTDWHYVKRTNDKEGTDSAVVITTLVKIKGEYNFLFLKTKRPPLYAENKAAFCLESPAGLIADDDKKETLIDCAKKELMEEAGLIAQNLFVELTNASASSGLTSETLSYVTAIVENDTLIQTPVSDGGIIDSRFYVPSKDILDYLKSINTAEISIASATVCGIYFALNRVKS